MSGLYDDLLDVTCPVVKGGGRVSFETGFYSYQGTNSLGPYLLPSTNGIYLTMVYSPHYPT